MRQRMTAAEKQVTYGELARLFLRMSVVAFGGPVAHIAMGEDEIVQRRKWLTREHYLDLIAATNLIPGPNSTEVMIHVGYTLRGIPGALVAGACFIVPAFLITLVLSVLYVSSGTIPQVESVLRGIMPVIVAIIAVAAYRLVPSALKNPFLWGLGLAAVLSIALLDVPEVLVMVGAGVIYALVEWLRSRPSLNSGAAALLLPLVWQPMMQVTVETAARAGLFDLFWYFLRIGSVLFGSGYVLFAYLQPDLVGTYGWLSNRELLDAITIGQLTPGPVLTTATAVGYIIAGFPGAVIATFAIFLPSFVFVILSAPYIPMMRRSKIFGAFLDGVNAGVIAAILVTVVALGGEALTLPDRVTISLMGVVLFAATCIALIRFKINATWMIGVGALVGLLMNLIGFGI
jgi:chromate transporter